MKKLTKNRPSVLHIWRNTFFVKMEARLMKIVLPVNTSWTHDSYFSLHMPIHRRGNVRGAMSGYPLSNRVDAPTSWKESTWTETTQRSSLVYRHSERMTFNLLSHTDFVRLRLCFIDWSPIESGVDGRDLQQRQRIIVQVQTPFPSCLIVCNQLKHFV